MNDNRMSYYSSGNYLHRLYLDQNPLIAGVGSSNLDQNAKQLLQKQIEELRVKEDIALTALAKAYKWGDTPEAGIDFLNKVLLDSSDLLDQLVVNVVDSYDSEIGKYTFDREETQNKIIEDTIKTMNNKFDLGERKGELDTITSQLVSALEKDLRSISFTDREGKGIYAAALEGFLMERVVASLFNFEFAKTLKAQGKSFNDWIERNVLAEYTGNDSLANANITKNKKQTYDVNITMDNISLPVQIRAKPKSGKPNMTMYTRMQLSNLVNASLKKAQIDALKTAIINQHYWAQGAYRHKVQQIVQSTGYQGDYVLTGAHPTAIERMNEQATINVLRPVIPLMRYAIYYNLVAGVNQQVEQLIYLVINRTKNSNGAVLRSSDMLKSLLGNPETLTAHGHTKVDGVQGFASAQIMNDIKQGMRRDRWYSRTSGIVGNVLDKTRVTIELNYADMNK